MYASLHDSVISHQHVMGLYQHDTYKIRPEFLGFPQASQMGDTVSAVTANPDKSNGSANGEKVKKKQAAGEQKTKAGEDSVTA